MSHESPVANAASGRASRAGAKERFNASAEAILKEWLRRQKVGEERGESPNAWFKREAYALLKSQIESGTARIFEENVRNDHRPHKLRDEAARNPFKLGLLAMFSDESPLSRNNRHVFGNQMLYAWLHDVPPEFLNGFLGASGGPAVIAEKLRTGFIEPGFENRHRADRLAAVIGD